MTSQQTIPATPVTTTAGDTAAASDSKSHLALLVLGGQKAKFCGVEYGCHLGIKRKTAKESWMSTKLATATVLFKMDKQEKTKDEKKGEKGTY